MIGGPKHKIRVFVLCWICWNLRVFWEDQMNPKSAVGGPKLISRTGGLWSTNQRTNTHWAVHSRGSAVYFVLWWLWIELTSQYWTSLYRVLWLCGNRASSRPRDVCFLSFHSLITMILYAKIMKYLRIHAQVFHHFFNGNFTRMSNISKITL